MERIVPRSACLAIDSAASWLLRCPYRASIGKTGKSKSVSQITSSSGVEPSESLSGRRNA